MPVTRSVGFPHPDGRPQSPDRLVWRLLKYDHAAAASIRELGDQRELRISIDGELLWSRAYERRLSVNLDEEAAEKQRDFVAMGWEQPVSNEAFD